ncbi:MAG: patatin-like phospholipase family protein [Candidatus Nanopelagicales bacterium]
MPELFAPPARPPDVRALGPRIPLAPLLPGPVHYAMAGGGSHGAVQWGLLQALSETDLTPDAVIGTSAGALSGVIYAEDPLSGLNRLAYIWGQLDTHFIVGENWLSRLANARQIALVGNGTERDTLESLLTAETFADLAVPFSAVATDVATGRAVVIDTGPLVPALLASSAIPGALPPVEIDGRMLFDGLASANLPAMPAVHRGAGAVVVLDTGGREPGDLTPTARRVVSRLAAILATAQRREQLRDAAAEVPVILLPTPGGLSGNLDFRHTMQSAATAYTRARLFLAALVRDHPGPLTPGLYCDPGQRGLGDDLRDVIRPVVP